MKSTLFRVIALSAGILLSLAVLEAGVRLFAPAYMWQFRDATADWRLDKDLGWVQRGNLDVLTRGDDGREIRFQTNSDGLTPSTAKRGKEPNTFRILILGDSSVVGRSVPQDKTINRFLQMRLKELGHEVEVLNGGVQGYSTDQVLLQMRKLIPLYSPDLVMYGFCSNDLGGNSLREAYEQAKPSFVLDPQGRLKEIPPHIKNETIHTFDSGPRKWIQSLAVYRFFQPEILQIRARFGGWQQRNLLGLAPEMYYRPEELEHADWRLFATLLVEMKRTAAKGNARFCFFAYPDIAEVWNPYVENTIRELHLQPGAYDRHRLEHRLSSTAHDSGADFCPLIDYFLRNQKRGPFHLLPRDPHCNVSGYKVSAEVLARFLVDSRMI